MLAGLFHNVSESQKATAIEDIIQHASPRTDFFLMMTLSVSMAAFGVILQNTVILIGSMLIAPLLFPLLSLAVGIITADETVMTRSLITLARSVGLALLASVVIGFLFAPRDPQFIAALDVTSGAVSPLMFAIVATIAGFAAAFATTKPSLNATLPGVAIAVALVPPLAVAGVGLSLFAWRIVSDSLLLFIVNVVGIIFSSMIVFALLHFAVKRRVAHEAVVEELKKAEKEAAQAEKKSE